MYSKDDVPKWIETKIRADVIEECMDIVPFRIDDGAYSDGFNDCSKKVLDRLKELKELENE